MTNHENHPSPDDEGKLGRVKELLFGSDLRALNESIERVMKVSAENRDRCEKLEGAVQQILADSQHRAEALATFQESLRGRLERIEARAVELATNQAADRETTGTNLEAARATLLEESKAIRADLEALEKSTSRKLQGSVSHLEESKVDRVVLSGVLNELALTLASQVSNQPANTNRDTRDR